MTLAPGSKLGPYEIVDQIGAGGMGEVYRAKDPRLGREVAIKVLPAFFDPDRLRRFEREAQAAGGLNHPNITAVHDIGTQDGAPYVVMELLRGETLRDRLLSGPIPVRKALDYGIQVARGLAAAHEASIIHRDLKPENLFITADGRVKILDFGLAKLTHTDRESLLSQGDTVTQTEPGVVLGTLGYMSPEQVKGLPADARSDLFSLGAVLYEMLAGKRAFKGDSAAETMSAILKEEPPELSETNKTVAPGLERVIRRCLEKNPEERAHSAHDLAFELETLSTVSATGTAAITGKQSSRRLAAALGAAAAIALLSGIPAFLVGKKKADVPPPTFQQLTFRRGQVVSARFGADGETIVYSAAWDGNPLETFVGRVQSADARPLGLPGAALLAVSSSGELAVSLGRKANMGGATGTLARVPLSGGTAPREVQEDVWSAEWSPDGKSLAVVRQDKLEYPPGKLLYQMKTDGWLDRPRVSADGNTVAFIEHAATGQDEGFVMLVERSGRATKLTEQFYSMQGLAWSPAGDIWFAAAAAGTMGRALYSVSTGAKPRLRARIAGDLTLHDISKHGRFLVTRDTVRMQVIALPPGESRERDLTWLDWSAPVSISADGKLVLMDGPSAELGPQGSGGGDTGYFVYLRRTDGSLPLRLGEGQGAALSPDGRWALAWTAPTAGGTDEPDLIVYPTGAGEIRHLPKTGIASSGCCLIFPDGKRFLYSGVERGRELQRAWIRDIVGGKPVPLTPEGYGGGPISPDGRTVLVSSPGFPSPETKYYLCSAAGGQLSEVKGLTPDDRVSRFSADGRFLYLVGPHEIPRKIYRFELATQRRELVRAIRPDDLAGVSDLSVLPSGVDDSYVYKCNRRLADLYLVDGLR